MSKAQKTAAMVFTPAERRQWAEKKKDRWQVPNRYFLFAI